MNRFGCLYIAMLQLVMITAVLSSPECVSHATLKCINDASSFWPRCDPSQAKADNFPNSNGRTRADYGHFCTQSWANALNEMLSHPVVDKCGDRDAQIKLLAQIAVETGYFSTLFQPADGGAGLVHMIPGNWQINTRDMEALFGSNFAQRQAATGATFFQDPNHGWLSVAAWYKQTNRVIPGCGKDLFDEPFTEQTRCIFSRANDRSEAFGIVSRCFGSAPTTTSGGNPSGCSGSPCPDATLCRSEFGHCGSSSAHCNARSTWKAVGCGPVSATTTFLSSTTSTSTTTMPPSVTTTTADNNAGTCIGTACSDVTMCRSEWGHCGSSLAHCNAESIWRAAGCGSSSVTTTLPSSTQAPITTTVMRSTTSTTFMESRLSSTSTSPNGGACSGPPCADAAQCRSRWGWCGTSPQHCNVQSMWRISGCSAGPSDKCSGALCASLGHCRSKWGHCGTGLEHCNDESTWKAAGCSEIQFHLLSVNSTAVSALSQDTNTVVSKAGQKLAGIDSAVVMMVALILVCSSSTK